MLYTSTRGKGDLQPSAHVIKEGLARDGGLFVPQRFPSIRVDDLANLFNRSYDQSAAKILSFYLTDYTLPELENSTQAAYRADKFGRDPVLLRSLNDSTAMLELWHGPTSAFKDMALQLLPHLLTKALTKTGADSKSVILVATSGDTGKAALAGFADVPNTEIMVFYPSEGVSPIQKRQMTTQSGGNVHVFGIEGNFDDAQRGVKNILNDVNLKEQLQDSGYSFSSANSINWGRLAPQLVYYFQAYAEAVASGSINLHQEINFAVPTGNFGDILAGYYAKKMGLPIHKLICASNSNNVLTDFINSGTYNRKREFHKTMSPSMDILISSNLERLLYDKTGGDTKQINLWMQQLQDQGSYTVPPHLMTSIRGDFFGVWVDEIETAETISHTFNDSHYLIDPHTAVALRALEKYRLLSSDNTYTVVLSTASPYKFSGSVLSALGQPVSSSQDQDLFGSIRQLEKISGMPVPEGLAALEKQKVLHEEVIQPEAMTAAIIKSLDF